MRPAMAPAFPIALVISNAIAAEVPVSTAAEFNAAIAAAAAGDVLTLAPGLYEVNPAVVTGVSALTIRSSAGPAVTTITLAPAVAGAANLLRFNDVTDLRLRGVTLLGRPGGNQTTLLRIQGTSRPKIDDCVFNGPGQGAFVDQGSAASFSSCRFQFLSVDTSQAAACHLPFRSSATFRDCLFVNNASASSFGGAISIGNEGEALVARCTFLGNSTQVNGGAIGAELDTRLAVSGSTFTNNEATNGGAIYARDAFNVRVLDSSFSDNRAAQGGAVFAEDFDTTPSAGPDVAIGGCTFLDDVAENGSSIFLRVRSFSLHNNVVRTVTEAERGPIVALFDVGDSAAADHPADRQLIHNTFFGPGEDAGFFARALFLGGDGETVANNIIRGYTFPSIQFGGAGTMLIDHNNIEGLDRFGLPPFFGPSNIDADPIFLDPAGGDFALGLGSPSINAASAALVATDALDRDGDLDIDEAVRIDAAGSPRIAGAAPDHGAFEANASAGPCNPADISPPGGNGVLNVNDLIDFVNSFNNGCP